MTPLRHLAILLAVVLTLAACGTAAPAPDIAAPADTGQAFPVVLPHAFGETTVPSEPQRVVALGYNDIAVAAALGAPIVGAIQGSDPANPNLPYLAEPLPPDVLDLSGEVLEIEKIAAHRPDLILATSSYLLDEPSYRSLSDLAPVVVYEEALFAASPNDEALLIGRALGREDRARELVDASDAAIAAVTEELPGLDGRSYLFGQARGEVLPLVVGEENQSTAFMRGLGLDVPAEFADVEVGAELAPGTIGISYEEASRLDSADLLFMTFPSAEDRERFEANPVIRDLAIIRDGRYLATSLDAATFLQAPNVAGTRWFLEQVGPTLRTVGT